MVRAALLSGYGTCSFFLTSPVKGSATTMSVSFRAMYLRDAPLMMPLAFFRIVLRQGDFIAGRPGRNVEQLGLGAV